VKSIVFANLDYVERRIDRYTYKNITSYAIYEIFKKEEISNYNFPNYD